MTDPPSPSLPPAPPATPRGIRAHLVYTWRAFGRLRAYRRALEALDVELRDAVAHRDEALAGLGEATLAGSADRSGDRIGAFAVTLAGLDTERSGIDGQRETFTIELAAAEADRRARVAEFEARRERLDAERVALERGLAGHRRELAALTREAAHDAALRTKLHDRLTHITDPETLDAADDTELALYTEERPTIEARLAELDEAVGPRDERLAALAEPIGHHEDGLAALDDRVESLGDERARLLEAIDGRIAELRASREEVLEQLARLDERRRAALVDLGREALHLDDGADRAAREARETLEEIARLRRERTSLHARRAAFDDAPIRRTAMWFGGVFVALLILRALLP